MRAPAHPSPPVRFLIELSSSEDGVSGWLRREDEATAPFASWLELLGLLEPASAACTPSIRRPS